MPLKGDDHRNWRATLPFKGDDYRNVIPYYVMSCDLSLPYPTITFTMDVLSPYYPLSS